VSRYAGEYEHVFETTTAGVTIQAPQVDDLFYVFVRQRYLCVVSHGGLWLTAL